MPAWKEVCYKSQVLDSWSPHHRPLTWFFILTDLDLGLDTEKASLSLGLPGLESSGAEIQVTVRGLGAAACIGDNNIVSESSIVCFSGSSGSMMINSCGQIEIWVSEKSEKEWNVILQISEPEPDWKIFPILFSQHRKIIFHTTSQGCMSSHISTVSAILSNTLI